MTPLQRMRGFQAVTGANRGAPAQAALAVRGADAVDAAGRRRGRGRAVLLAPGARCTGTARCRRAPASGEASPLSYRVDNGEIGDGGYLRSFGGSGVGLLLRRGDRAAAGRGRARPPDQRRRARRALRHRAGRGGDQRDAAHRRALADRRRSVPDHRARHGVHRGVGRRARAARHPDEARPGVGERAGRRRQDRGARRPAADHQRAGARGAAAPRRRRGARSGDDRRRHRRDRSPTPRSRPLPPSSRAPREARPAVGARVQSSSSMRSSAARAAVAVRASAPRAAGRRRWRPATSRRSCSRRSTAGCGARWPMRAARTWRHWPTPPATCAATTSRARR